MVDNFDFDECFDHRHAVQLLLVADFASLVVLHNFVLLVKVQLVLRSVRNRPVVVNLGSDQFLFVLFVLVCPLDAVSSDRHILCLDYMHEYLALLHTFECDWLSLLDYWL